MSLENSWFANLFALFKPLFRLRVRFRDDEIETEGLEISIVGPKETAGTFALLISEFQLALETTLGFFGAFFVGWCKSLEKQIKSIPFSVAVVRVAKMSI